MSCVVTVRCLRCLGLMAPVEYLAHVVHTYGDGGSFTECMLVRFRCGTPDCGNEVIVEDR